MQEIVLNIIGQFGYVGVFLLIAIENIFPPIPSEVILLFGGFMTTYTKLNILGMVIASTLGSVLGAIILYYIGKIFNKDRLKKIISGKLGKILRLKNNDIDKADTWFDTKGQKTVFFCRFIPLIRSLISIPAGMSEMPLLKFLTNILSIFDTYSSIVVIALGLMFIIFVTIFYKKRLKHEKNK